MTLIKLGNVSLRIGMTKAEAEYNDEKIKKANHGKTPIDKNGKELLSNVSLFMQYDTNKNGVIDESEYNQYRDDNKKKFEKIMKNAEQDVKNWYEDFKKGKTQNKNETIVYVL